MTSKFPQQLMITLHVVKFSQLGVDVHGDGTTCRLCLMQPPMLRRADSHVMDSRLPALLLRQEVGHRLRQEDLPWEL